MSVKTIKTIKVCMFIVTFKNYIQSGLGFIFLKLDIYF